jgi:hypothetical protein
MLRPDELDEKIFAIVDEACSKDNLLKYMDVQKKVLKSYPNQVGKNDVKFSVKRLVDGGRLVYAYLGGSFLVTPTWRKQ